MTSETLNDTDVALVAHDQVEVEGQRIACVGSGPSALLLACALKRGAASREVVVDLTQPSGEVDPAIALWGSDRYSLVPKLEGLLDTKLPLVPWRQTLVIRDGATTIVDGGLGCGIDRDVLSELLLAAARHAGCRVRDANAAFDRDSYTAFDVVAVDAVTAGARDQFGLAASPTELCGFRVIVDGLAADRVIEVAETSAGPVLGQGHVFRQSGATFRVDAPASVWERLGLTGASRDDVAAFACDTFGASLGTPKVLSVGSLEAIVTIQPERWWTHAAVLLGGSAVAAGQSFLLRAQLELADALALSKALLKERSIEDALKHYEKERRNAALSAERADTLERDWSANLGRYKRFGALSFSFNALTRSMRVNHRDLQRVAPNFVRAVDQDFAGGAPDSPEEPVPPMFVPYELCGLTLPNRVGVSPMCMYSAEDGTVDDFHLVHLGSRAMGGAGLVFAEMSNVSPEGRITKGCAGMYRKEHVEAWRRIVDFVHTHTPAKIAMQLGHAGRRASTELPWLGMNKPLREGGWETVAPSPVAFNDGDPPPREMSRADMDKVVEDFARATSWSVDAGFDLLEIHMAHGYLLSTFISPLSNLRTDEYGGSLDNRTRFPLEVLHAVRAAWPEDRPLSVRISAVDWAPGGSTIEDMVVFATMLKDAGVDIIDVSTGNVTPGRRPTTGRLFQTSFSERIRTEADVPTMTVGRISSYGDINSILAAGRADLCLLAKGYLKHPYFTQIAAETLGHQAMEWPKQYRLGSGFKFYDEA